MQFDRFVGIPYRDRGRDQDGCDCWGLVRLVYRDLLGIELPSYHDRYVTAADRAALASLIAGEMDDWRQIESGTENTFDCVLMREGKFPRHVGLVVAPGLVLHVESENATSQIERYRSGILANRVVGFHRYRDNE